VGHAENDHGSEVERLKRAGFVAKRAIIYGKWAKTKDFS